MKRPAHKLNPKADKREHHYLERMHHHSDKYAEFHWPSVELLINLAYTYDVIYSHLARKIEAHGLSLGAFNVLMILSRDEGEGCPMHKLGELLLVSRANVTGLVDFLARRGLVERSQHESDRRVRLVRLTRNGEKLLESILPAHYARVRALLKGVSNREKAALSKLLMKLRHNAQLALSAQHKRIDLDGQRV
jgi:MarR family 2-MHQ and catechol resistance regulon transcriptional repressor